MAEGQLGAYLENYLESVSGLPGELKRNFTLIEELDRRTRDTLDDIENMSRKAYIDTERREKAKDEKISLATQTYEMVDKHIRRLDIDLRKFEAEIEKNAATLPQVPTKPILPIEKKKRASESGLKSPKSKRGNGRPPKARPKPTAVLLSKPLSLFNVDLDMPVDPNEPTYCFCKRVSFGEMVGCDNENCRVEWFHFECVGIKETPKGKWLCPECAPSKVIE